jgi:hypothetical protein
VPKSYRSGKKEPWSHRHTNASHCVSPLADYGVGAHAVRREQAAVVVGIGRRGVRVIRAPLVASERLVREVQQWRPRAAFPTLPKVESPLAADFQVCKTQFN